MNKLTYCIVYKPESYSCIKPNLMCKDNTIHIRFRKYTNPEVISGTVNKLTYLVQYLFNYNYLPNTLIDKDNIDALIDGFLKSTDIYIIEQILAAYPINCNSIKIFKAYNKKYNTPFGIMSSDVCPVGSDETGKSKCSLSYFLVKFNTTLSDYLLNDNIEICIINKKSVNIDRAYLKYNNKIVRNKNKHSKEYINTNLW